MGYYGASLFDFRGLMYFSAALQRLILFLSPTLVVIISALVIGYRIQARDVFALAISYAGNALVFIHDFSVNRENVLNEWRPGNQPQEKMKLKHWCGLQAESA